MRSIITRFSIVNARGGSVSQDIEFLEVEEARKLLFASTMKDDRQLKDNIRHHEFRWLFNISPALERAVRENGSGTTFLKLVQILAVYPVVFNIDQSGDLHLMRSHRLAQDAFKLSNDEQTAGV